jgi:hypothetical protein
VENSDLNRCHTRTPGTLKAFQVSPVELVAYPL